MYSSKDITMVICIRLHGQNPWVLDRLKLAANYYNPAPRILIVDFGSESEYQAQIKSVCNENDVDYFYVDDKGVYSAAVAHNRGFEKVSTDLVLFSDIDFVFKSTMFGELAETAISLEMNKKIDTFINFTAYHLNKNTSEEYSEFEKKIDKDRFLTKVSYQATLEKNGNSVEFIAPYSNVYLMNVKLYSLIGGYHESFRGHGSEDFEFFIRLAYYTKLQPIPEEIEKDKYGPTKRDFLWVKQYRGFRRLNEALALPSELMGFKVFHLWHPTKSENDWRSHNDWRRERMTSIVNSYKDKKNKILNIDFINRNKNALCICKHEEHYGYFSPLRIAGYKLDVIYDGSPKSLDYIKEKIKNKDIDAFVIFNPYMKSHAEFYPYFLLSQELNIKTIVVERGALPNTIYYSSDVSYNSLDFSLDSFNEYSPSSENIDDARSYIEALTKGNQLLETASDFDSTYSKYEALTEIKKHKIFIPLQLDDDMAVTKYVRNSQSYNDFSNSINQVAAKNTDKLFVVKAHPLSKKTLNLTSENIIISSPSDNVHALLEVVDSTICYNSGVGLLSIIHGRPTITIGNAFYNVPETGCFSESLEMAVNTINSVDKPNKEKVEKLVSWYLNVLYSNFVAADDIKEFKFRKAHSYKDILVTDLKIDGLSYVLNRISPIIDKDRKNYVFSKLNVPALSNQNEPKNVVVKPNKTTPKPTSSSGNRAPKGTVKDRRLRKLRENPKQYFADSSHILLRPLKALFPDNKFGRINKKAIELIVRKK
ncbi:hypothetical protein OW493_08475 [Cobetia sp. 14N.309.X.WAT.E.A4]|uniref:capsular polysaccharide export protein, LipB/KpsS family n=1 Tax=Cobetia sp. 14N.309.X.WAT.E.A4 TaxID=2998323 RepID=UPI0025B24AAD|nr:glycosyltransferase [Cobetia sp. 14N.309.X.WAT.E.A4]MDN2656482.1 hypothetical protein [Cobetia sp. 14N.309.X.WAT.E.A4]